MKVLKITNVMWLPKLAPRIEEFAKRLNQPAIVPGNLYAYFNNIVQFGGATAEFWVVIDGDEPIAFASFALRQLPHTGTTCMDFIHNWSRKRDAVRLLVDEWMAFGKKNRCLYYDGIAINEQTMQIFKKYADEIGLKFKESGLTSFTCRV